MQNTGSELGTAIILYLITGVEACGNIYHKGSINVHSLGHSSSFCKDSTSSVYQFLYHILSVSVYPSLQLYTDFCFVSVLSENIWKNFDNKLYAPDNPYHTLPWHCTYLCLCYNPFTEPVWGRASRNIKGIEENFNDESDKKPLTRIKGRWWVMTKLVKVNILNFKYPNLCQVDRLFKVNIFPRDSQRAGRSF